MDRLRQAIGEVDSEERSSLSEEKIRNDFATSFSETTITLASMLAFVLIGLMAGI